MINFLNNIEYQEYRDKLYTLLSLAQASGETFKNNLKGLVDLMEYTPDENFKESLLQDKELQEIYNKVIEILDELEIN